MNKITLSVKEYCNLSQLTKGTVIEQINRGKLKARKTVSKVGRFRYKIYIPEEEFRQLINSFGFKRKVRLFLKTYSFDRSDHKGSTTYWKRTVKILYTPTKVYFNAIDCQAQGGIYHIFFLKPGELAALDSCKLHFFQDEDKAKRHIFDFPGFEYCSFSPMVPKVTGTPCYGRTVSMFHEYKKENPRDKRYIAFWKYRITEIIKRKGSAYYQDLIKGDI